MPASSALLNALATQAATLITYVGLVNGSGTELSGGSYARQPTTATATGANVRITDETFNVPAGATVAGWRAFSASTGGTDFGGGTLTSETYAGAGTYTLTGASTGFNISAS